MDTNFTVALLGILAGIGQLIGYVVYYHKSIKDEIQPNPTTWLMFGYGTALLLIMEWDSNASWELLILPLVCSLCGIGIAVLVYHKEHVRAQQNGHTEWLYWPDSWKTSIIGADGWSFKVDLMLTVTYSSVWAVTLLDFVSIETKALCVVMFLLISNMTTFTEFGPLVRQVRRNPHSEDSLAWWWWGGSYCLLLCATALEIDPEVIPSSADPRQWDTGFWEWSVHMMYPIANLYFHFLVGWLARPRQSK